MTQPYELAAKLGSKDPLLAFLPEPQIKVALVGGQTKARGSWIGVINSFPDLTCVCSCVSAEEALATIPGKQPDAVLMDIFLPRMSGIECTARLKARMPALQIVMFTAIEDQELLVMALEAGADGYLLKRTKPAELRNGILDVLKGGVPMSTQMARRLIESFRHNAKGNSEFSRLSGREDQILQLVSKGHSNALIARKLNIAAETVSSHLKRVFKKLHVRSRTEAAARHFNFKLSRGMLTSGEASARLAMPRSSDCGHKPTVINTRTSVGYVW